MVRIRHVSSERPTMNTQCFYAGEAFDAQDFLGAHPEGDGTHFRVFAPAAEGIVVVGDSGQWEMHRILDGNFWEAWAPACGPGEHYLYRIYHHGSYQEHCDPYGFAMELRPSWRSIVCDLSFTWHDQSWMDTRAAEGQQATYTQPMNIYEMHLGSWRKRSGDTPSDNPEDWYSYEELAEMLPAYLKASGYDYVEFMPLSEYPFDGSWGYQPTGFFAATSRYGTPTQLMTLVDALHAEHIGVILDFVPVHFAVDAYGLASFDGTPLFEYPNQAVGVSEWGSCNFMHSRGETCSFLQSAANFWLGAYHIDGLRLDAISRIIYWQGDEARGENGNAMSFIRRLTSGARSLNPGALMIAEDSTNYRGTTRPVEQGGLGFDYKWDMGWMHDTLDFFKTGPVWRPENYHKLSFSMMYFHDERFLLPLSHDEVVHGKATILQKMQGSYEEKFPQGRVLYLYMMTHPGKKLHFMGSEIGQLREWDEQREQDWFLRTYPLHESFYRFCQELNHIYLAHPALWEADYDPFGFQWRQVNDQAQVVYAFERRSLTGTADSPESNTDTEPERLLCVLNLSDTAHTSYVVDVPDAAELHTLINTDWQIYAGTTPHTAHEVIDIIGGKATLDLPPYTGILFSIG